MHYRSFSFSARTVCTGLVALALLTVLACSRDYEMGSTAFDEGNYDQAMDLWMPLAEKGHAEAQFGVAYLYEKGLGVPEDATEAVRWYRLAADQGHASSQLNLGTVFLNGRDGVSPDLARAADWMTLAAQGGNPKAQYYLGKMYFRGEGLPENHELAFQWFEKAADQDEPRAINHLGIMYNRGYGVEQDLERSLELIHRAADMGEPGAQANLATQYVRGRGTEQDFVEGLKWFTIYKIQNPERQLPPMDFVDRSMTPEQIAEAERRARQWIDEHDTAE